MNERAFYASQTSDIAHVEPETVYLDLETTGLHPEHGDEIIEICILDDAGVPLLDTLVRPTHKREWPDAQRVNGISPSEALDPGVPNLSVLLSKIDASIRGKRVVIYNASFDSKFLQTQLQAAAEVRCAMREYAQATRFSGRWLSLEKALSSIRDEPVAVTHRAKEDCIVCREVWHWLQDRKLPDLVFGEV